MLARLYFTGRLGRDFKLSSLQAALLCGIGLQSRDVDSLTSELNLPSNQVLAMFNKAVRKMSLALNSVLEDEEKAALLGGKDRLKAEMAADRMRNVAEKTLDEDASEAAQVAMSKLNKDSSLPPEIVRDDDIMQYAVKGSEEQWSKALNGKDIGDSVQIHSVREMREKRKLDLKTLNVKQRAKRQRTRGVERKSLPRRSVHNKGLISLVNTFC
jgi:N-acetyltransferase 10